jgi:hypothetical protein
VQYWGWGEESPRGILTHNKSSLIVKAKPLKAEILYAAVYMMMIIIKIILIMYCNNRGHAVVQRLRHCATNRKVAESIPDGFNGIFH